MLGVESFPQSGQGPLPYFFLLSLMSGPSPQGPSWLLGLLSLYLHSRQRHKERRKGTDKKGKSLCLWSHTILLIALISQNLVTLNYKGRLEKLVF